MKFEKIGSVIQDMREERNISRLDLCNGLCAESMLIKIERNERFAEMAVMDNLIRRMGKSPDKLELVVSSYDYEKMEAYDDLIDNLRNRDYDAFASRIKRYEKKYNDTDLDAMYIKRLYAILAYQKEHNYKSAEKLLDEVIAETQPEFQIESIRPYSLACFEMENILMRCYTWVKLGKLQDAQMWVEKILKYIDTYVTDEEERVKIFPKGLYLLSLIAREKKDYVNVKAISTEAIESIKKQLSFNHLHSHLELLIEALEESQDSENLAYYKLHKENLEKVYARYEVNIESVDVLYYSQSMRQYFIDCEIIRDSRVAQEMSQQEFIEGIYKDATAISRLETGKTKIKNRKLQEILEKLNIHKERYNCYLSTTDFYVLERLTDMQQLTSRRRLNEAEEVLDEIESRLDMSNEKNRETIDFYRMRFAGVRGEISQEEKKEKLSQLLIQKGVMKEDGQFCRIPFPLESAMIVDLEIALYKLEGPEAAAKFLDAVMVYYNRTKVRHRYMYRSVEIIKGNRVLEYIRMKRGNEALIMGNQIVKNSLEIGRAAAVCASTRHLVELLKEDIEYVKMVYNLCAFYDLQKHLEIIERHCPEIVTVV